MSVNDNGADPAFGLLGEERKIVTVVFCDLVGSTELSERLDPESLRAVLGRYFDRSRVVLDRHGGTVEKFIGDAVMAVFGVPTLHEDDPIRAVRAAGELVEEINSLSDELERTWGVRLQVRIGVNTGQVVAGDPRTGQTLVSGSAVNVAARLEQGAGPGEVLVGEQTFAAARTVFEFGAPTRTEAKGTSHGVVARRLLGEASASPPPRRAAFVGREDEVASLLDAYHRVSDARRPLLVTVVGHPGVGKTRLLSQFSLLLRQEESRPALYVGRCLAYGRGVTYAGLDQILRQIVGLRDSDSPEDVLGTLGPRRILGLTLGVEVDSDLHPLAARQALHRAWVGLAAEVVADRPAVFVVEDVHWAQEPLLDLLAQLLREVSGPLLLISTARPEARSRHWAKDARIVDVELEPLPEAATVALAAEFAGADLPVEVRDLVLRRAEGNPFFIEELISSLIDQNILARDEMGWIAHELPAGFAVPNSVQAVLAGRIDLLPPLDKAGLQAASVIGRNFWPSAVRELLTGAEADFATLEEREFIRRLLESSLEGDQEFGFKHELTREVAYGSLLKQRRARLHAAFAAWLERVGQGRDDWAPVIGHHYAESVRADDVAVAWPGDSETVEHLSHKAVVWLRRAADLSIGRYAIDEALALLRRALELESDETARGELWHAIGRAAAIKYDGVGFWEAMLRAVELTRDDDVRAEIYSELALETNFRGTMWKRLPDDALIWQWVDQALALAAPGSRELARALIVKGNAADDPEAVDAGLSIATALDDVTLISYAYASHSLTAFTQANYTRGVEWAELRLGLMDRFSDPDHRANIEFFAALPYLGAGRLDDARTHAQRHEDIALTLNTHQAVHALGLWAVLDEAAGEWDALRTLTGRVEPAIASNIDTPCSVNQIGLLTCAVAYAYIGDEKEADRLVNAAEALGMEGYGVMVDGLYARLALIRGDLPAVERLLQNSDTWTTWFFGHLSSLATRLDGFVALGMTDAVEQEASRLAQPGTYLEPFALRALGQVRADQTLIDTAATRFETLGLAWHASRTRAISISA